MNVIFWLMFGGLIGWGASLVMGANGRQGILLDVAAGMMGALLGGWLLGPLVGSSTIDQNTFNLSGLVVSLPGSIAFLAIVRLVRGAATQ